MSIRKPYVAGRFYPSNRRELEREINSKLKSEKENIKVEFSEKKIIGGVVPHAGYMFSGYQAVHFFEIVKQSQKRYDTVFIINPNHTGYGPGIAMDDNEFWETPFGNLRVDFEFVDLLGIDRSPVAHQFEHSGEVMLPFLQYFLEGAFEIVPITIMEQTVETAKYIAEEIFLANKQLKKEILVIASSDFCHYKKPEKGRKLDQLVLNEILKFDSEAVYRTVKENEISVCGFGPIMTLIEYSKLISEQPKTEILKRGHSGEVSLSNEVVDYVSMLFFEEQN